MKKILFVASTLNTGGAQKILSNLIMSLPEDYEATIVLNDAESIVYPYKGKLISLGLKKQDNKRKIFYQFCVFCKRLIVLRQLKKTGNYIATISFLDSANFANVITGNRYCKVILTSHGFHRKGWANPKVEGLANQLIRCSYKKADKVVAVSYGLGKELQERFKVPKDKIKVIYNGYNVDEIIKLSKCTSVKGIKKGKEEIWIATSGRLERVKGQWHLIKAFSVLCKNIPNVKLIIMGDGSLKERLKNVAEEHEVEDRVLFTGFVNNPFEILAMSDVFVLSSLSEGYPNAIAEAMICGLPCISVDCESGPREMLSESFHRLERNDTFVCETYGILCPPFDENDSLENTCVSEKELCLADAMELLINDLSLREHYKMMSQEKSTEYDMKKMIHTWIEVVG